MPTGVLSPLALTPVVGLWIEVCTPSYDSSTTNSDAEP
jgi:hypothetical protein